MRELFKYWSLVISLCEMDPWTPQNSLNSSDFPSTLPPPFEFGQRDINSDQYLSIIEGKLQRLKGATGKEPAAKDILIGLDKLRDCQMHSIIDDTSTPYVSNADFEGDSPQQSAFQVIQRKLVPEKQAVSLEETKPLVDNDVLAHIYDTLTNATITEVDQQTEKPL